MKKSLKKMMTYILVGVISIWSIAGGVNGVTLSKEDKDTFTYKVGEDMRLDVLVKTASKEGKKNIVMKQNADYIHDMDITPNFTSWKGLDWLDKPEKKFVANSFKVTVTFKPGTSIEVENIDFLKKGRASDIGVKVVVERGATVKFKNSKFDHTIVNNGVAIFDNCQFATNEIENNGNAEYKGGTKEPKNIGKPKTMAEYKALAIKPNSDKFDDIRVGKNIKQYNRTVLEGSEKRNAKITVYIKEKDTGLDSWFERDNVVLSGNPKRAGEFTVIIKAETLNYANKKDITTKGIKVKVVEKVADDVYEYDSNVRKTFEDAVKEAQKQNKRKIDQSAIAAVPGNVNITSQFTNWYGTDGANNPMKKGIGFFKNGTVTFKKGADVIVENIDFEKNKRNNVGVKVKIEEGAKVKFINCSFGNTVENYGEVIFENVKFHSKEIINNGIADYINTEEPKNLGTAKQRPKKKPDSKPEKNKDGNGKDNSISQKSSPDSSGENGKDKNIRKKSNEKNKIMKGHKAKNILPKTGDKGVFIWEAFMAITVTIGVFRLRWIKRKKK